jgi:hypothetical protein
MEAVSAGDYIIARDSKPHTALIVILVVPVSVLREMACQEAEVKLRRILCRFPGPMKILNVTSSDNRGSLYLEQ